MDFSEENHPSLVLADLRRQRANAEQCDVKLCVADQYITAHRCVLAASSDYFRTMFQCGFNDRDTAECLIPNVSFENALDVVDFMYTGKIRISLENVQEILRLSDFLCIKNLKGHCSTLLKSSLTDDTCLGIKLLVDQFSLDNISPEVEEYLAPRIDKVLFSQEALELPINILLPLLQDSRLNYINEQLLCKVLITWLDHDADTRRQFVGELLGVLDFAFLPSNYIKETVLTNKLIFSYLQSENNVKPAIDKVLAEEQCNPRNVEDVIFCRSRTVRMGEEVQVLLYLPRLDTWLSLQGAPEPHCWDGLESMVLHLGSFYFLVSTTEDMYGYMHHAQETKHLWALHLGSNEWEKLSVPQRVRGQCRLVSHVNGLFVIDRQGLVEEFDLGTSHWIMAGPPGFSDNPSATLYLLPMPVDRHIYVLRAFSAGYSFSYAQMSLSLFRFDTVRHTWDALSDVDADELDLEDHERVHGYTFSPGTICFKNELGHVRLVFDLTTRTWSSRSRQVALPSFVKDVWGSASFGTRVYFVGRMTQETPQLMMYDHGKRRFKAASAPTTHLSGLLCHVLTPASSLLTMGGPITQQLENKEI